MKQTEKAWKRKATVKAKLQWKRSRYNGHDNTYKSRQAYFRYNKVSTYNVDRYKFNNRYDGGTEADDIPSDIPPRQLQEVAINYYKTKVVVNTAQAKVIELTTAQHSSGDRAAFIQWKTQRRM